MRKFIAALALLFLTGCGPPITNPHSIRFGKGHALGLSAAASANPKRRAELTAAAEFTVKVWERFNGPELHPTLIIVSDEVIVHDGLEVNGFWTGGKTVVVWAGEFDELPALFHELCHRAYLLQDHSDVRWGNWDKAGNACYHTISSERIRDRR